MCKLLELTKCIFFMYSLLLKGLEIKLDVMTCVVIQNDCRINFKDNTNQCMFATELWEHDKFWKEVAG